MAVITMIFGALLVALGIGGYLITGRESLTALIPAIPGALFLVLGALARNPGMRKHAMHIAAAVGLLGFLGSVPGVIKLFRWAGGTEPGRPAAVVAQSVMAVLCAIFVALCVKSFIDARKRRAQGFEPVVPG